ncbi:helix-turn-helix domain-containing protein [Actinokineospora inagensis]|uniref:helix-turn-helix domain-containing protein n=1 Tax=Actinokineospora inagensis TaxID=103730 RepID=UPI00047A4550|nr:helix-turn-helix transcriptional regulator [Actinokineospora inagensis]
MSNSYASAAYRELGGILRQVRENADMSATDLATRLGWQTTMVSRMENGWRTSTITDVVQYVVACGMKLPEAQPLLEFARMAECKLGYYLSDVRISGSLQSLIFHESSAERSVIYEPQVVHGLLQTPDYARALIAAVNPDDSQDWMECAVRTRMEQRRILSASKPARFTFYIHEQALRFQVGTAEVMHEQLLHLVLTAALENVSLRVVPAAAGQRFAVSGAFHLMEFHQHRPLVYVEHLSDGGLILEDHVYLRGYYDLLPTLADIALDEGQSREFAADLADEFDRGSYQDGEGVVAQEQLQRRVRNSLRGGGVVGPQPHG